MEMYVFFVNKFDMNDKSAILHNFWTGNFSTKLNSMFNKNVLYEQKKCHMNDEEQLSLFKEIVHLAKLTNFCQNVFSFHPKPFEHHSWKESNIKHEIIIYDKLGLYHTLG